MHAFSEIQHHTAKLKTQSELFNLFNMSLSLNFILISIHWLSIGPVNCRMVRQLTGVQFFGLDWSWFSAKANTNLEQ